jgi:hypothetical protein
MLKKEPDFDLLYKLQYESDGFYREPQEIRNFFYDLFKEVI